MRRLFYLAVAVSLLGVTSARLAPAPASAATAPDAHPSAISTGTTTPTAAAIVATAEQYVGYPYAYIGDTPQVGFSCIGFAHFVYAQHGIAVPEELGQAYASAPHVDAASLQPGDLVFFQNTYWAGISHVDIYIGNGKMIGADSPTQGVQWDTLSDAYWQNHYLGAARPLATIGAPAAVLSATPSATLAAPSSIAPPVTPTSGAAPPVTPTSGAAPPVTPATTVTPTPDATTAPPASPASDTPAFTIMVGAVLSPRHVVTVYDGPSTTATAIDMVTPAMALTVIQTRGHWVNVSYRAGNRDGWRRGIHRGDWARDAYQDGWVRDADLPLQGIQPDSDVRWTGSHPSASPGSGRVLVVTADVLFVRAAPSTHAQILRRVYAGDRLQLVETVPGWDYVVQRGNGPGWVSAAWVT